MTTHTNTIQHYIYEARVYIIYTHHPENMHSDTQFFPTIDLLHHNMYVVIITLQHISVVLDLTHLNLSTNRFPPVLLNTTTVGSSKNWTERYTSLMHYNVYTTYYMYIQLTNSLTCTPTNSSTTTLTPNTHTHTHTLCTLYTLLLYTYCIYFVHLCSDVRVSVLHVHTYPHSENTKTRRMSICDDS